MKTFLKFIYFFILILTFGCSQYEYSQFKNDDENELELKKLYVKAISTCDNKDINEHRVCFKNDSIELQNRHAERHDAFMTPEMVASIITTQIVVNYEVKPKVKKISNYKSKRLNVGIGKTRNIAGQKVYATTSGRSCVVGNNSKSISLSSFVIITATCF